MQRKNESCLGGSLNCRTIIQMGCEEMMGSNQKEGGNVHKMLWMKKDGMQLRRTIERNT
jgi:hypothetical protein